MARRAAFTSEPQVDGQTRICVVHGAEHMRIRETLAALRGALEEAHGAIQVITCSGQTSELADVLDELRTFGLLQEHKLVVVEEADDFVKTHRQSLERYAASPVEHATLVLWCSSWRPGNLDKLINKCGCIVKCEPLTAAAAGQWLTSRAAQEYQRKLPPQAAQLLIDRLGTDLLRLDNELGKLALMVAAGQAIDIKVVEQLVGKSSDEQAWAVQEAMLTTLSSLPRPGSARAAIEKIRELIDLADQPEQVVMYFIADLMRKLYLAKQMLRQGVSQQQIAKEMKLWGPRQNLFMTALGRLDEQATRRMFEGALRADARSKSGLGDLTRNLECFCASLR